MQPDIANVLERLARLEQQNDHLHCQDRRWKWASGIGLGLILMLALSTGQSKSDNARPPESVEAQSFLLKDSDGAVQGGLCTSPAGPVLALRDPRKDGTVLVAIQATKDGPLLNMFDDKGRKRVSLSRNPRGSGLVLLGDDGKPRVVLGATDKGLAMELADGGRRIALTSSPETQQLEISEDGSTRLLVGASKDAVPQVSLFDSKGKGRMQMKVGKDEETVLVMTDEGGKERAHFSANGPEPGITFRDDQDRVRVRLAAEKELSGLSLVAADKTEVFLENSSEAMRLMFLNSKQKPLIGLGVSGQGPVFGLYDEKGKELFKKP